MATKLLTNGDTELVSPANGSQFTLEELQEHVGGYIQLIHTPGGRLLVIDEEGKLKNKPINERATGILRSCGPVTGDCIVGDALWVKNNEID